MPYFAMVAALLILSLPTGDAGAGMRADGFGTAHTQLAYDDETGREDRGELGDSDEDDNAAPGYDDDDNYYDGEQGDSAHGMPPEDDDDQGDDEDDGVNA